MGLVTPHVNADLTAYAERRLSARQYAQVEAHLAVCRTCRDAAADTAALVDALQAAPAALRPLERGAAQHWPEIWARVAASARPAAPHPLPRLSFYMSLMAVAFSAATLLPGTFGLRPAVTAGVVETPVALALTPRAAQNGQAAPFTLAAAPLSADATVAVAMDAAATPAGPAPAPTPKMGP